jgi:hypothetical protein
MRVRKILIRTSTRLPADFGTLAQLQAYIDVNAIPAEAPLFPITQQLVRKLINTPDDKKTAKSDTVQTARAITGACNRLRRALS